VDFRAGEKVLVKSWGDELYFGTITPSTNAVQISEPLSGKSKFGPHDFINIEKFTDNEAYSLEKEKYKLIQMILEGFIV
jgi:hypothetical protein